MLNEQQIQHFNLFGYVVLSKVVPQDQVQQLKQVTEQEMKECRCLLELEAGLDEQKNHRLLDTYNRHEVYKKWAESAVITESIKGLLEAKRLYLSLAHNNCIVTKAEHQQPDAKADWHRGTRFWDFNNKHLINTWLALGDDPLENRSIQILAGSHLWDDGADIVDENQCLLEGHPSNAARLALAKQINLKAGDCLLFNAHCFHSTDANHTNKKTLSLVFSYHGQKTQNLNDPASSKIIC